MAKGFDAVYNKNSKILILGSFPSIKSRQVGFYYGNKQNRFWKMLSYVYNCPIKDDTTSKINFLLNHNIALYDVVTDSDIKTSADADLVKNNYKLCNIDFLLPPNTKVNKILCNGKAAYNLLIKNFNINLPIYCLPSTSSANPYYSEEEWKNALKG